MGADTTARVGLHGTSDSIDVKLIFVHAGRCRDAFQQFFLNTAHRELTIAAFKSEMGALA